MDYLLTECEVSGDDHSTDSEDLVIDETADESDKFVDGNVDNEGEDESFYRSIDNSLKREFEELGDVEEDVHLSKTYKKRLKRATEERIDSNQLVMENEFDQPVDVVNDEEIEEMISASIDEQVKKRVIS